MYMYMLCICYVYVVYMLCICICYDYAVCVYVEVKYMLKQKPLTHKTVQTEHNPSYVETQNKCHAEFFYGGAQNT